MPVGFDVRLDLMSVHEFKEHRLKSLCESMGVFVGRGFSHDIRTAKSARLQPLTF